MATRPIKLKGTDEEALDDIASALPPDPTSAAPDTPGVKHEAVDENVRTVPVTAGGAPVQPKVKQPNRDDDKKSLMRQAKEFGKADGAGKRAFIRFARVLVQGGASGVLTPSPKSQDAGDMYRAFSESSVAEAGGLTTAEKASQASQLSKVRAFIRLGQKYEDEAEPIFDDAMDLHKQVMASPELSERVKLRSTYAAVCSVAVAQCKPEAGGQRLTREQMEAVLLNEPIEVKETTGVSLLIQALNLSESAHRGRAATEKSNGREPIRHQTLVNIIEAMRVLLGEIGAEELAQRDADIAAIAKRKADAKAKREQAEAEKEAKAREAEIQKGLTEGTDDLSEPDEQDEEELVLEDETE